MSLAVDRDPVVIDFRVEVAREGGGVRVRPVGEVDVATIGRLRARMDDARAAGADRVILDLRATTFLDSAGLHLALDMAAWATRNRTEFLIIPGPAAAQIAFDASGLRSQLPFVDVPRG
jgi:anti-anti-sigma factor